MSQLKLGKYFVSEMIRTSLLEAAGESGGVKSFDIEVSLSKESIDSGRPVVTVDAYARGPNFSALFGQFLLISASPLTVAIVMLYSAKAGFVCAACLLFFGVAFRRRSRHLFRKSKRYRSQFVGKVEGTD